MTRWHLSTQMQRTRQHWKTSHFGKPTQITLVSEIISSDLHCLQSFARLIEVQGQKHNELDRMRGREVSATLTLLPAPGSVFPFATAVAHAAHTDGCIATSALDTALR